MPVELADATYRVKQLAARLLGPQRWSQGKAVYRRYWTEPQVRRRPVSEVEVGAYTIRAPAGHPTINKQFDQPYRDRAVGHIARAVADAYPDASFVDIGANIGDTAALMASAAPNPLILVEPSDYFHELLVENVTRLPNVRRIERCLVGVDSPGQLRHWGGTAVFEPGTGDTLPTRQLAEIVDDDTRFVKIDTDGYDFAIIRKAAAWLAAQHPALYYEVDCSTDELLGQADAALDALAAAGYRHFAVWDDPGFLLLATDDIDAVRQLQSYLHRIRRTAGAAHRITGLDVLATIDRGVRDAVVDAHRNSYHND